MNEIAEKGLAAHWKYKEVKTMRADLISGSTRYGKHSQIRTRIHWIFAGFQNILPRRRDLCIYTEGDVKMLPVNATALDFAFSVHTAVGTKCIGAKR